MPSLVAVSLTGPRFPDMLTEIWSAGDTLLPVDPRLPAPAAQALLEALRPRWVVGHDGRQHRRQGSRATSAGDALVVPTSGTTGTVKAVVLTHDAVAASARATSARLGVDPGRDQWLACLPLAHIGGLSVVTRALLTVTPLSVLDGFDAAEVVATAGRLVAQGRRPLVALVATTVRRVDATAFGVIVLGGGPAPALRPSNAVVTYGMTETGSGVVYDGTPLEGVEVRIDDGQVLVRGPMLGRAYRSATRDVPLTSVDGWLSTGDAGHWDADGLLVVDGRLDDVVVTGGEKVWPSAIEEVLRHHADIAQVAVVGTPDAEWGERVVAVVVPVPGQPPPSLEAVRETVKAVLPPYAAPRQLVLANSLPTTRLGKVHREALAQMIAEAAI